MASQVELATQLAQAQTEKEENQRALKELQKKEAELLARRVELQRQWEATQCASGAEGSASALPASSADCFGITAVVSPSPASKAASLQWAPHLELVRAVARLPGEPF
ncbi:unnamed protein product [Symbiodinium sp. CCMP2592]|nr:unnamed protein product [Symbiodinium sp. CCMP2592]